MLYVNILLLNPDAALEKQAGAFSYFAKTMVDHDTLTATIAETIRRKAEKDMRERGFEVDVRVRESHSRYCVLEIAIKKAPVSMFNIFNACCETQSAAVMIVEKAMAAAFPTTLKSELRKEGIEADVVVVRETEKQEQYEIKVLDLLYPPSPNQTILATAVV
mmetsp:Transcript_1943/g.4473  ORF Transcript_1943/g.4473 Transcript_1943/m.4473 type:complete len:162 (+) Transcript_1943:222-707(+)|eukprot:CAMPEP_0178990088 /NCGR_PEP_ID=MMETSP0795-20121207/4734_1 /TAXON_ID=88552 /ORGANISM="Amoebophrya sp., Strain Ameob2" /LENGTH=161 /DNA_ID=CAMNT_0020681559 /DNA_START=158 /DNA_END=643 /DNA_ORIENTATION=+